MLLGDSVKAVLSKLGVDKVVEKGAAIIGKDCGCSERQETFNNFGLNLLDFFKPEKQRNREEEKLRMMLMNNHHFRNELGVLYEKYTGRKYTKTECVSCNVNYVKTLYANPEFQKVLKELQIEMGNLTPAEKIKKAIVNLNKKPTNKVKPRKRKLKKAK